VLGPRLRRPARPATRSRHPVPGRADQRDQLRPTVPTGPQRQTHGGWVHILDPQSGALTQISPLGRAYTTTPIPPVGSTGLRAHPPDLPISFPAEPDDLDEIDFPTGEPPQDPADEESAPPDPVAEVDHWPTIARIVSRSQFNTRPVLALAAARAEAAERALIHRMHAELEAATRLPTHQRHQRRIPHRRHRRLTEPDPGPPASSR
jgi:hypothetical protein